MSQGFRFEFSKPIVLALLVVAGANLPGRRASAEETLFAPPSEQAVRALIHEVTSNGQSLENLKSLLAQGPRLCGSKGAENAVQWAKKTLEDAGLDRVWLQPVTVHAWTRGEVTEATLAFEGKNTALDLAALGNSSSTPASGLEAPVVEVQSLSELKKLGRRVTGKIVFFNRPFESDLPNAYLAYSKAVDQRTHGPAEASKLGAIAAIVRSISSLQDDSHPHTGITLFAGEAAPIPAAALSTQSANFLSAVLKRAPQTRLKLRLDAHALPDVVSHNVVGEIWGREKAEEIVAVGGHLDSWDLSPGAHDDGAGVVQAIEATRTLRALGLRPKRTIRTVLFMCEETGGEGGDEYARLARENREMHLAALESDRGGYAPLGFSVNDIEGRGVKQLQRWATTFEALGANRFLFEGSGGADVDPLHELGAITFGLMPDSRRYFDLHHSALDQFEAVEPEGLRRSSAALAALTYLLAEEGL